jgi:hypothetical protein
LFMKSFMIKHRPLYIQRDYLWNRIQWLNRDDWDRIEEYIEGKDDWIFVPTDTADDAIEQID